VRPTIFRGGGVQIGAVFTRSMEAGNLPDVKGVSAFKKGGGGGGGVVRGSPERLEVGSFPGKKEKSLGTEGTTSAAGRKNPVPHRVEGNTRTP